VSWNDWYDADGRLIRDHPYRSSAYDPDDWCTWEDPPLMPGEPPPPGVVHDSPEYISLLPKEEYYRQRDAFEAALNPPVEDVPPSPPPRSSWWRRILGGD
jgi:hypothetical protein